MVALQQHRDSLAVRSSTVRCFCVGQLDGLASAASNTRQGHLPSILASVTSPFLFNATKYASFESCEGVSRRTKHQPIPNLLITSFGMTVRSLALPFAKNQASPSSQTQTSSAASSGTACPRRPGRTWPRSGRPASGSGRRRIGRRSRGPMVSSVSSVGVDDMREGDGVEGLPCSARGPES